jgi:predicted RNA-binding protein YlxR (DUF448 family)
MCLGCRKRKRKEDLVRLIKGADGHFFLNDKKELSGRGYYLCPDPACLKLAQKKQRELESLGWKDPLGSLIEERIN